MAGPITGTGDLIRTARKQAGLSAEQLGEAIGVAGNTVLRYERGELAASVEQLEAIGRALGLRLVIEYRPIPRADMQNHYREMFRDVGGVGVQLLARALYRVRHGDIEVDRRELRELTISLREQYGETVERQDALAVIESA